MKQKTLITLITVWLPLIIQAQEIGAPQNLIVEFDSTINSIKLSWDASVTYHAMKQVSFPK